MKIGLAAYKFKNKDLEYNIAQIEKAIQESKGDVELLCFGENFLQGFDSLSWSYEIDKDVAITQDSATMQRIFVLSSKYQVDLLFGYIEREGESIYSACAVIEHGKLIHNYRRISKNWKEYSLTDDHYCEGDTSDEFIYHDKKIMLALCGDLWLFPERFKTNDLLIWPIYVNFDIDEWKDSEQEYANQALLACSKTLMVNSITDDPVSHGNAFYFLNGQIEKSFHYDIEGILVVEV